MISDAEATTQIDPGDRVPAVAKFENQRADPPVGGLQRFEIAPDSSSVAFAAIGTGSSRRELYYAPLDASEKPVQASQALVTFPLDFRFTPDGRGIVHFSQRDEPGVTELFLTLIAPSAGELFTGEKPGAR